MPRLNTCIECKHHFIREQVLAGELLLKYVLRGNNHVDMFSKSLAYDKLEHHRTAMGMQSIQELLS